MLPAGYQTAPRRVGGPLGIHTGDSAGSLSSGRKSLRILVADDEPDTVLTMVTLLEEEGYEVLGLHDGADVLRETRKFKPDAVLLDIGMPGMTGYDVARALRAEHGAACPTLIAVTAYARTPDHLMGRAAGFHHYFGKPVELKALFAVLSDITPRTT